MITRIKIPLLFLSGVTLVMPAFAVPHPRPVPKRFDAGKSHKITGDESFEIVATAKGNELSAGETLEIDGGQLVVAGTLVTKGTIRVKKSTKYHDANLLIAGGTITGPGTIEIEDGAKVRIDGGNASTMSVKIKNDKGGLVEWSGNAPIFCGDTFELHNSGNLKLSEPNAIEQENPDHVRNNYPKNKAKFYNHSGGVISGAGVLNGELYDGDFGETEQHPTGQSLFTPGFDDQNKPVLPILSGRKFTTSSDPVPLPAPSPSLITVTGGYFGMSGSVFQVTINNSFHGQLSTAGPVYIYAGTTIKTVVDANYNNTAPLPVILAASIGGSFPLFQYTNPGPSPAVPNFKFKRRIVAGSPVKYELWDFPNP